MKNLIIIYLKPIIILYFALYIYIFIMEKYSQKKSTKTSWRSPWILIKIGFIYAKKIDNHYYANLIIKLCKKHLKIKDITTTDVLQDLYSSTKFGPFFNYRNIKGFMNSSMFFWVEKNLFLVSGFMIFLHRNNKIDFSLSMYMMDFTKCNLITPYLSALDFVEFLFLLGIILRILSLLHLWNSISDRRVSIHNSKSKLLTKLNSKQRFYFFLGVILYSLFTRLGIISKVLIYYLVICNLNITPLYIDIGAIFVFIPKLLDFFFNLCGFTHIFQWNNIGISLIKVLNDSTVWIFNRIRGFIKLVFKYFEE